MINDYDALGEITEDATFNVYNVQALTQYLHEQKGKRVTIKIVPCGTPLSKVHLGYYFNVVVPQFQRAFFEKGTIYTCQQTDETLREMSPLAQREFYDMDSKKWISETKDIHELTSFELSWFISHLKLIAAEEFSMFIEDPNTLK
jgi:hypothetical protein